MYKDICLHKTFSNTSFLFRSLWPFSQPTDLSPPTEVNGLWRGGVVVIDKSKRPHHGKSTRAEIPELPLVTQYITVPRSRGDVWRPEMDYFICVG